MFLRSYIQVICILLTSGVLLQGDEIHGNSYMYNQDDETPTKNPTSINNVLLTQFHKQKNHVGLTQDTDLRFIPKADKETNKLHGPQESSRISNHMTDHTEGRSGDRTFSNIPRYSDPGDSDLAATTINDGADEVYREGKSQREIIEQLCGRLHGASTDDESFEKETEPRNFHEKYRPGTLDLDNNEAYARQEKDVRECCKITGEMANCSHCNLTGVPIDLPRDIKVLILSQNHIASESLLNATFANYSQLACLWLDSNNITYLPDDTFEGLGNLLMLSLYDNMITLDKTFQTSKTFHPLNSTLVYLAINRNCEDTDVHRNNSYLMYPDQALSGLIQLKYLYIDGLQNVSFGDGFRELSNLTNLTMAGFLTGYCNMMSISNETFRNLNKLKFLDISDCNLNGSLVEHDAFSDLRNLEVLDVSNNFDLGIEAVGKFMFSFINNSHFRHLKMRTIGIRFASCIVVYNATLKHFKSTSLEIIEAMDNEIEMVEAGAIKSLPPTLKFLNLTNNKISFGAYWRDMAYLKELVYLHVDWSNTPFKFPTFYPPKDLHCPRRSKLEEFDFQTDAQETMKDCVCGETACVNEEKELLLPLPPKLTKFTMHRNSLAYIVDNITFCSNNSLKTVDISGNIFKRLMGPVCGLENLTDLDLSDCSIEVIGPQFFDNFPNLERLDLYQNLLGDTLNADSKGEIFDNLIFLKYLNLSYNDVYKLGEKIFKDLKNLEVLDLSYNRLGKIRFSIDNMKNLHQLDLHKNSIASLPSGVRNHITKLLKNKENVTVSMSDNPISCYCSNLEFLEWVVHYDIFGQDYTNYYCVYSTNRNEPSVRMLHGYAEEVARQKRQCASNAALFLGVTAATLFTIFVIVGFLLYRFRWTLRYWYHAAKLKVSSTHQPISEEFEYDVFVSYANEDLDFVLQELSAELKDIRHLTLLIHGEHFQVGRHITDNIYMAVRQSRKTLVVVTRSMLASHWCTYEMQMARMEGISTGRNTLIFLFLEEIPTSLLSVDVIGYIKTSTYISYPENPQRRKVFWDKLASDLTTN